MDCVNSCKLDQVFKNVGTLPAATTKLIVSALLEQLPDDDNATIMSVKQDMPNPPSNGQGLSTGPPKYDPSVAYILEFTTMLATRDPESIDEMAEPVFQTVQGMLRDSSRWHAITVSRAVFYALRILKEGFVSNFSNVGNI